MAKARASNPRNPRSWQESVIVRRLIWQEYFKDGEPRTQQALARELGVSQSYVSKVYRRTPEAMADLSRYQPANLTDLQRAQRYRALP